MNRTDRTPTKKILISGASIAGPALALWLGRCGHEVTVVERATSFREGGGAVDYRGSVHREVLERMGVLETLRGLDTGMGEQAVLDESGRELLRLPASFMSGELEVTRGDLARTLYEASLPFADYVFGDSVRSLTEHATGVTVEFEHGETREFDLVVGADGIHSTTRRLAFGPEEQFRRDSGWFFATFSTEAPKALGLRDSGVLWNDPGRMVGIGNTLGEDGAMLVFHAPELTYDHRNVAAQKELVLRHFADAGWEVPAVLRSVPDASDFYFDSLSQIVMDRWSHGRIVLLGDAAWAPAPGGMGNGLAVVGAYVLAGELATAPDHRTAFARYEERMRPYVAKCQKQGAGAGRFLAPVTGKQLKQRNRAYRMLCRRTMRGFFEWLTTRTAEAIDLPAYGLPTVDRPIRPVISQS
ncbi:FAD-dependent monooxygenase [Streptacidiphilus jiangxiensis]|uniref:2-polyprenyl-6-methoxyphenol hydroxylase n=1 Tax=Streptacidiphilus jiangxiensis TaxID=235985 RepID=A0A1H7G1J8_STRJI|nr:FAD-dependent monooxygenase [Streptacidiphilus jiangxiensis]SEK31988.1 2-polyprenyl-6-methoxyphenol hydroxylase [Streptacidiphilus jiangxiensis]